MTIDDTHIANKIMLQCITAVDWSSFAGLAKEDVCTVEASVVTGFETAAASEAREKLRLEKEPTMCRGRIVFDVPADEIDKVLRLRTIDNAWVIFGARNDFGLAGKEKVTCSFQGEDRRFER